MADQGGDTSLLPAELLEDIITQTTHMGITKLILLIFTAEFLDNYVQHASKVYA